MARSMVSLIHDQAQQMSEITQTACSHLAGVTLAPDEAEIFRNMLDEITRLKQQLQVALQRIMPCEPSSS